MDSKGSQRSRKFLATLGGKRRKELQSVEGQENYVQSSEMEAAGACSCEAQMRLLCHFCQANGTRWAIAHPPSVCIGDQILRNDTSYR